MENVLRQVNLWKLSAFSYKQRAWKDRTAGGFYVAAAGTAALRDSGNTSVTRIAICQTRYVPKSDVEALFREENRRTELTWEAWEEFKKEEAEREQALAEEMKRRAA